MRPSDAYIGNLRHHWWKWWLLACSVPSHYPIQLSNIVNWTHSNKLQWHFNRNWNIFIQGNAFLKRCLENVAHFVFDVLKPTIRQQVGHWAFLLTYFSGLEHGQYRWLSADPWYVFYPSGKCFYSNLSWSTSLKAVHVKAWLANRIIVSFRGCLV